MIHETSEVSKDAKIGKNVKIWSLSRIREGAVIGNNCIIGSNVYIDHHVKIGSNVKIQNNALIFYKTVIESGVFIGPAVCFTNDKYPRATNLRGELKTTKDWKVGKIFVKKGASIGAGSILLPGIKVGSYSMVGAGSVVTKSVPEHALVVGNPAKILNYICFQGHILKKKIKNTFNYSIFYCNLCKNKIKIKNEK